MTFRGREAAAPSTPYLDARERALLKLSAAERPRPHRRCGAGRRVVVTVAFRGREAAAPSTQGRARSPSQQELPFRGREAAAPSTLHTAVRQGFPQQSLSAAERPRPHRRAAAVRAELSATRLSAAERPRPHRRYTWGRRRPMNWDFPRPRGRGPIDAPSRSPHGPPGDAPFRGREAAAPSTPPGRARTNRGRALSAAERPRPHRRIDTFKMRLAQCNSFRGREAAAPSTPGL